VVSDFGGLDRSYYGSSTHPQGSIVYCGVRPRRSPVRKVRGRSPERCAAPQVGTDDGPQHREIIALSEGRLHADIIVVGIGTASAQNRG
jgi:hypothetical protein